MTTLIQTIRATEPFRTLTRFLVVGALGTLVDFSLFALLSLLFGVPVLIANTLSYSAGIVNNYLFHRAWTYASRPKKTAGRQFAQFAAVSLSALVLNNVVVLLLTPWLAEIFPLPGAAAMFAKLCAIGIGMAWNFTANHFWIFHTKV